MKSIYDEKALPTEVFVFDRGQANAKSALKFYQELSTADWERLNAAVRNGSFNPNPFDASI